LPGIVGRTTTLLRRQPLLTLPPRRMWLPLERRPRGELIRELTPEERRQREDELLRGLILRRELFPVSPLWGMPPGLRRFPLLSSLAGIGTLGRIPFGRIW